MGLSSPGIGSGLDVNGIVSKLMTVEQQPLTELTTKEASFQAQLTAYGTLKGAVSSFQDAVVALNDPGKFKAYKASVSDSSIATASAVGTASAGSYSVNITKLAQTQSLVGAGQASMTAAIGSGATTTLTFDFGAISGGTFAAYTPATGTGGTYTGASFTSNGGGAKTITIDSSNNSLSGIRDAINQAGIGVTASIVNDGSASPYRLVLTSSTSGAKSSMNITVSGDAAITNLLGQNPAGTQHLQETVTAQNTEMTVNGVFVSKTSNVVTDAINGVTLTALTTGSTTLTVGQDTTIAVAALNAFVKTYNDLNSSIKTLTAYDPTTKRAAVLLGDSTTRLIQSRIRSMLSNIANSSGSYQTMSQVGITFNRDGSLAVDSAKMQSALTSDPLGVAGLFASAGKPTDSLINYVSSTSKTQAGTYAVSVSQLATQGSFAGTSAAGLTITAGVNDTLSVSVNGVSASVTLAAKTYATAADIALELQSKINGATSIASAGASVSVTQTGGVLTLTSNRYGSDSSVYLTGSATTNLLGASPLTTAGLDVGGTINGVSAAGSGQYLLGATADKSEGLKLLISGGAIGNRGTVSLSQGYAYRLNSLLSDMTGSSGPFASATDGINRSIKDIGTKRDVLNRRLTLIEANYRKQFTALDTLVSNMNQTSTYLTQQLAKLP